MRLYKKIKSSERLPGVIRECATSDGRLLFTIDSWKKQGTTGRFLIIVDEPKWWLESVEITEEKILEILNKATAKGYDDDGTLSYGPIFYREHKGIAKAILAILAKLNGD